MAENPTNKDIFRREERRDFLRAIEDHKDLIFFRLGFYAGLRISEILSLDPGKDLIFNSGMLPVVHVRAGKGNKDRYVILDEGTAQLIKVYTGPWFETSQERTYQRRIKEYCVKAGITRISPTPHTLRHTHITMILEKGLSLERAQAQAGHNDIKYTQIYTHLTYEDRARSLDRILGE